jgi:hypothetical protein
MRTWIQGLKKEHLITMMMTMGMVGVATAAQAAGGGGIPAWAPMGNMLDSIQGVPAFVSGTVLMIGGAVTMGMGEIGMGAKRIGLAAGATGLMTNAAATANAWGIAGALS